MTGAPPAQIPHRPARAALSHGSSAGSASVFVANTSKTSAMQRKELISGDNKRGVLKRGVLKRGVLKVSWKLN